MIQEIITYMIIGAAIAMAVSKMIKKFKGKKPKVKSWILKNKLLAISTIVLIVLLNVCYEMQLNR